MITARLIPAVLLMALGATPAAQAQEPREAERNALVREVIRDVRATSSYTGRSELGNAVIDAIRTVPRHEFVPPALREYAYVNQALPIGEGQTISQPYVVAMMTDLAEVGRDSTVLEIGTGSGYQAAVLAEIVDHVYTIEIVAPLGERARGTLERLGYDNVTVKIGDGYRGWPEHAPFDAIVVTAAPETVPQPLIEQLDVGGRLVIPVGPDGGSQFLKVLVKAADGSIDTRDVLPVRFVPFTRD